ncbi:hypothetical protein Tco_1014754 [Tanacetum coccineum]
MAAAEEAAEPQSQINHGEAERDMSGSSDEREALEDKFLPVSIEEMKYLRCDFNNGCELLQRGNGNPHWRSDLTIERIEDDVTHRNKQTG